MFSPIQENWYMPIVMGEKPAPRSGYVFYMLKTVVCFQSELNCYSYMFIMQWVLCLGFLRKLCMSHFTIYRSWLLLLLPNISYLCHCRQSTVVLDDKLVMFGGWDMPIVFSDLHVLDLTFVKWSQPKTTGTHPSPRR